MIESVSARLRDKIAELPDLPGVYIFKDEQGNILYIGKAKSLKKRLQSYFVHFYHSKTQVLLSKVNDIEYVILPSESQAQLLEASLIKEKQPPYNVSLKDDKYFPYIRITDEEFPMVCIYRKKMSKPKDNSLYFGPYTNAKLLRQALKTIRKIFGFRSCRKMPKQACLYYRIKMCPAPCENKISPEGYRDIIQQIKTFLESRYEELLDTLYAKMKKWAQKKKFEEAAKIRDQIYALSVIQQSKPGNIGFCALEDLKDLLGLERLPLRIEAFDISNISGKEACGSLVSFYKGLPDKKNYRRFRIKTLESINDYAMLREVIRRRYTRLVKENLPLPDLILIDGGKAHLSVVEEEIKGLGLEIPLLSIAKDRENIYVKNKTQPIKLQKDTSALNLIRYIRDEAHRFAQTYHHLLRRKKILGR
ncbi:MAG: excinuclease ABC subunit UvrC [Candidatus Omnitrophica bacterium]|nr:excinuclease ABC subunit UvrC [Candidatus Omnitrophota bacterium]